MAMSSKHWPQGPERKRHTVDPKADDATVGDAAQEKQQKEEGIMAIGHLRIWVERHTL